MEPAKQIETFKEFLDERYELELLEAISTDKGFIVIDFSKVAEYSPDLASDLLEDPENVIRTAFIAAQQIATKHQGTERLFDIEVRFRDLPASSRIAVGTLRSKELRKLIQVRGIVRQKSDVRPQVVSSKFECPACGAIIPVLQVDMKFKEPTRCQCGRKGQFREISKQLVDAQKIVLEEASDELDGSEQPKRLNIILKKDLVSPLSDRRSNPGSKIEVTGYLTEVPVQLPQGQGRSTRYDIMMEGNWVEPVEEEFGQITISPEEIEKIKEMASDPQNYHKLVTSIAPSIYGHDKVKEALVLQLLGGVKKIRPDGVSTRGDMHVLLIGDPGSGKSQMIRRMTKVAPKARFVSGKGSSAAGLTASVVKDEFLRGYALEAGALVLANKGFAMIDELDKMSPEDRSAFHEALEQQCYHYDTELLLADGSVTKIGELVERTLAENRDDVIQGKDCEILPLPNIKLLTTDFERIGPITATAVSRHVAPKEFIKITYSNGRSITVTPEHPVFTYQEALVTTRADAVKEGMLAPAPRTLPRKESSDTSLTPDFGALLGYLASEGHSYLHPKGTYAEIGVSNTAQWIVEEVQTLFENVLKEPVNINVRPVNGKATLELMTVRTSSVPLYHQFIERFPELAQKAPQKRVGNVLRTAPRASIREFLRTAFHGDGFVTDTRLGYATASRDLAKDYQDLLLTENIYAYIRQEMREGKTYYKVVVSGNSCLERFVPIVANDHRVERILLLLEKSALKNNDRDVVPNALVRRLDSLLKKYRVSDGYFHRIIARGQNAHRQTVAHYLKRLRGKATEEEIVEIEAAVNGDLRFVSVVSVERVPNTDQEWVYDVQVEPTHAFISEDLVLHNTVTISKANIQATLRCETVVLAAANPKYGRFDPYELLAKQIDLPSTLINRFDLIFPIKDLPSKQRDEEMAHFILTMHQTKGEVDVPYTTDEIKKFIAYARQHCQPRLSEEALEEIKKFYVDLRNSSKDQEMASIPISARQLEGLVRLSEASAKSRLSPVMTREDAKKAIELVYYCLSQIGIDPQTGKLDIDRASGNMPASERNVIHQIREIIKELSEQTGQALVPEEDIIAEAKNRGIQSQKADDAIQKLNQKGDIYQPRPGFYSMMK